MNWELFFAFIILLSIIMQFVGILWKKIDILKLVTYTVFLFFSSYVIVSGLLFWIDKYTISLSICIEYIIFIIFNAFLIYKNRTWKYETVFVKRDIILFLIILFGFFISFEKFDYFGMGQDQGVYQVKAIELIYGHTKNQLDFKEYNVLETNKQREEYNEFIGGQLGLYRYDNSPTLKESNMFNPVSGIFHGIPTFPAVLALFGKIFGIENMHMINSILYLCAMFFILFIIENLKLKRSTSYLVVTLVALSPVIQWVNKSTLTENGLYFIIAAFMYAITSESNRKYLGLAVLSIWAYSFYHVSTFALIPMFVLVFFILYLETNNKDYLYSNVISLTGFFIGFLMMLYVSPQYSFFNLRNSIGFNDNELLVKLIVFGLLILLVLNKLVTIGVIKKIYYMIKKDNILKIIIRIIILTCIIYIFIYFMKIYNGQVEVWRISAQPYYNSGSIMQILPHIGIISISIALGVFAIPIAIILLFKNPNEILKSKTLLIIGIIFIYSVLIFSAIMKKEIYSFYYYSRYLAPFIVMASIGVGIILNQISSKFLIIILSFSFVILIPYDLVLLKEKDDSLLGWTTLKEIVGKIEAESAVVVDNGIEYTNRYQQLVALPIKAMTGADIYPLSNNIESQLDFLKSNYENIYIISNKRDYSKLQNRLDIIYLNSYITSLDYGRKINKYILLPREFEKVKMDIALYKYQKNNLIYDMSNAIVDIKGFGNVESNNFRWIVSDNASMAVFLDKKNYTLKISQGPSIPLSKIGKKEFSFDILINDKVIETITLNEKNLTDDISIELNAGEINDGKNIIGFKGKTWSPSEYGSADERNLIISVSKLEFKPINAKTDYNFNDKTLLLKGFDDIENNNFRWIVSDNASMVVFLDKKNYTLKISQGPSIPLSKIGKKDFSFDVLINNKIIENITLNEKNLTDDITIELGADKVNSGKNTISFKGKTWSPSEYGSADKRNLMISISKVKFINKK